VKNPNTHGSKVWKHRGGKKRTYRKVRSNIVTLEKVGPNSDRGRRQKGRGSWSQLDKSKGRINDRGAPARGEIEFNK